MFGISVIQSLYFALFFSITISVIFSFMKYTNLCFQQNNTKWANIIQVVVYLETGEYNLVKQIPRIFESSFATILAQCSKILVFSFLCKSKSYHIIITFLLGSYWTNSDVWSSCNGFNIFLLWSITALLSFYTCSSKFSVVSVPFDSSYKNTRVTCSVQEKYYPSAVLSGSRV